MVWCEPQRLPSSKAENPGCVVKDPSPCDFAAAHRGATDTFGRELLVSSVVTMLLVSSVVTELLVRSVVTELLVRSVTTELLVRSAKRGESCRVLGEGIFNMLGFLHQHKLFL